jgi:hypothetical protein
MKTRCAALIVVLLFGCGEGDEDQSKKQNNTPKSDSDISAPRDGGGSSSSSEYDDFVYDDENKRYVSGAGSFPEQADSANAFLITVFLKKDGTFVLFYAEGNGKVSITGHALNIFKDRQFKRTGEWTVTQMTLDMGGLMRCNKITFNGAPALYCNIEKAIGHSAAVDRNVTLKKGLGSSSPDDSEWAEYK